MPASRVSALLSSVEAALIRPFSSFPPYSASASLSSSQPPLHADWQSLLTSFASSSDVAIDAAASLLRLFLRSAAVGRAALTPPSAAALRSFYHAERRALLGCVSALFRLRLDPAHAYHELAAQFTSRWLSEDGERALLSVLSLHARGEWKEDARQHVAEQVLMMDTLFLVYYDADDAAQADGASKAPLAERVAAVVGLLHSTHCLSAQGCYLWLDAEGRRLVERLRALSVLVLTETMMLGKLRVILEHPVFALLEEPERERWMAARSDEKQREDKRSVVQRMTADVQDEFDSLLFSDTALLAQMDAALTAAASPLSHPFLLLAWSVLLSLMVDYHEELTNLQTLYDLPSTSPPSSPLVTRSALLQRLNAALSFPASPFAFAASFLSSLSQCPSLVSPDEDDPCASGYKEIINELLTTFCASSLYPLLTFCGQRAGAARAARGRVPPGHGRRQRPLLPLVGGRPPGGT